MSMRDFYGRWQEQAGVIDDSGRWASWTQTQPALVVLFEPSRRLMSRDP